MRSACVYIWILTSFKLQQVFLWEFLQLNIFISSFFLIAINNLISIKSPISFHQSFKMKSTQNFLLAVFLLSAVDANLIRNLRQTNSSENLKEQNDDCGETGCQNRKVNFFIISQNQSKINFFT